MRGFQDGLHCNRMCTRIRRTGKEAQWWSASGVRDNEVRVPSSSLPNFVPIKGRPLPTLQVLDSGPWIPSLPLSVPFELEVPDVGSVFCVSYVSVACSCGGTKNLCLLQSGSEAAGKRQVGRA